jgi:hypothetical protein
MSDDAVATASGTVTVTGVGAALIGSVATATGAADATGASAQGQGAVGQADGVAAATAVGRLLASAVATAAGLAGTGLDSRAVLDCIGASTLARHTQRARAKTATHPHNATRVAAMIRRGSPYLNRIN